MGANLWNSIEKMGDPVEYWPLVGRDRSGGYSTDVFADSSQAITVTIRPWQSDIPAAIDEGFTGETPGLKMYASQSHPFKRNDRVHFEGGRFRVVNPQHDPFNDITRWDLRSDERELIHIGDLPNVDEEDLESPDRDSLGDY